MNRRVIPWIIGRVMRRFAAVAPHLRLALVVLLLVLLASCSAATPSEAPSNNQPSQPPARPTQAQAAEPEPTRGVPQPTATRSPSEAPTQAPLIEGRLVELEWPETLRIGDSDVIRLALVPTREGYVARAEFPDHQLQTKEVPIPRPNGYELYAIARLDGVGFDIAPSGDQERFVPTGEEVAWRWSLSARQPGQQRLSVQLRLRWVPGPGVADIARESQAYSRGLDVQVRSFLGLSPVQASTAGLFGLLFGSGCLFLALIGPRRLAPRAPGGLKPGGPVMEPAEPNPAVEIETPAGLALSDDETGLLRALFQKYDRLVIENEFLSGYSGARTFLVRPIRPDGCADALTIVKLGPRASILREYQNFEDFVKDRLPPMTARIQRPPVTLAPSRKGSLPAGPAAMQYTFIAEPGRPPVSLRRALLENPDPADLLRLFETFGPNWWMQRRPATFRLGQEYDALLPPHYVLEPLWETRPRATLPAITETRDPAALNLPVGAFCVVLPFSQSELRADGESLTLLGTPAPGRPALRLRWLSSRPPAGTPARIITDRMELLRGWTAPFERFGLPDPLDRLPTLLDETISGTRSIIHGDLNLENVLVGPGNLVWLIDFAQTREGHPLFDFAHLESELIAHILSVRAGSPRAYLDLWRANTDPLLTSLHAIAARCLFDPARPREYHLALYLACLGALKYRNLSDLARRCLYLTAADLLTSL